MTVAYTAITKALIITDFYVTCCRWALPDSIDFSYIIEVALFSPLQRYMFILTLSLIISL